MEKHIKYLIVLGVFVLSGVFLGWWVGKETIPEKTVAGEGGSAWAAAPSGGKGDPEGAQVPAHLTQTVNNSACTTSPPQHVLIPQPIPASNPMFCWDTFGNNITSWSFILKDKNLNPVTGCNTPGYPAQVSPSTTSITCQVNLTANAYYYGFLAQVSNGTNYTDYHAYVPQ